MSGCLPVHWDSAVGKLFLEAPTDQRFQDQNLIEPKTIALESSSDPMNSSLEEGILVKNLFVDL